ncbi:unnamed protein product [Phaedon cochleariae]|uniref:Uncharacterized protein n=1 Tax=Phaedon cochleariae TaxID=80249 RepID=A0A9P0DVH3_PHACE|nr:unnamed protein product [Phaedon cochleariae]
MEFKKRTIYLKIRRSDMSAENHPVTKKTFEIAPHTDASVIKNELQRICNIGNDRVMKIRNKDGDLVPISFLADPSISETHFLIDVAMVSYVDKKNANLLQDAYVDAVQQKINSLESRIAQSELLLPQLEWRRQAYMEDTVNGLLNKVAFLNRRFDELLPQITAKDPETMA